MKSYKSTKSISFVMQDKQQKCWTNYNKHKDNKSNQKVMQLENLLYARFLCSKMFNMILSTSVKYTQFDNIANVENVCRK